MVPQAIICSNECSPSHIFVRDGSNLHCEVPISFAKQSVVNRGPSPGKVKLKIPPRSSGKHFDSGKVLPVRGVLGDLCVRLSLKRP